MRQLLKGVLIDFPGAGREIPQTRVELGKLRGERRELRRWKAANLVRLRFSPG